MTKWSGDAPPQASSQDSPEQVSPEWAVDTFLKRLTGPFRLLVAFSGGGDSTGLLAALSAARPDYPDLTLHAATVDHGLRAGSAEEARAASLVSRKLRVPHTILPWTGQKPATGIQAAARDARYRLLAAEAERVGANLIVTGHTLDDQQETVFMRNQRKPGTEEGMDEAVLVARRIWVVRPFLQLSRSAIRDYLDMRRLSWSEDPSNDNPAFERVRVRQSGVLSASGGRSAARPNNYVVSGAFVRDNVVVYPGPVVAVDLRECHVRHEPYWTALAMLSAIIGGRAYGPDTATGMALVKRLAGSDSFRMTANRVVFDRRDSTLYLYREDRGLPEITIGPENSAYWDGRYEIVNTGQAAVTIGAGRALSGGRRLLPEPPHGALPKGVASRVEASTPRVLAGDAALLKVRTVLAPFDKFIPSRKLELANRLATAFELEQFPLLSLGAGAF